MLSGRRLFLVFFFASVLSAQELPNAKLTPGAIRTTDASEICAKSFRTAPYRHTTLKTKKQVCIEYGVVDCPNDGVLEIDHLVPIELGGADDIKNLWPQFAKPTPGFHEKDKLENFLKRAVCHKEITLKRAQDELRLNWYAAYKKYGLN